MKTVCYKGVEIPSKTSKQAKKAIRQIHKKGLVILESSNDIGMMLLGELESIWKTNGMIFFELNGHRTIFLYAEPDIVDTYNVSEWKFGNPNKFMNKHNKRMKALAKAFDSKPPLNGLMSKTDEVRAS